jgi:hypothetical protein
MPKYKGKDSYLNFQILSSLYVGWLKYGLTNKRHARGWLKNVLVQHNLLDDGKDALWNRVMSDYQCQLVAMEVMRSIQGSHYKDPRLVTEHGVFKGKEDGRYQKKGWNSYRRIHGALSSLCIRCLRDVFQKEKKRIKRREDL